MTIFDMKSVRMKRTAYCVNCLEEGKENVYERNEIIIEEMLTLKGIELINK